ncbi:hypothetical protein AVEN_233202-1 [Araneus ventricosus]|uniref:Pre-C2HC domain-containing protein n=1 Tax=Araneus ventricosus TaxID=182803 RepID=A0A4Y2W1T2_ARAVE|nr:hypothetical protein AVEN_233202-1 [Araneus ventricosus]
MDTEEQEKENSPSKISIPAINLKINNDYNLTLREINRHSPNTENIYDRGYIRILPLSLDDREQIIEFLNQNEKEYVLPDAPEVRPIKIAIKGIPPDHSKKNLPRIREPEL